MWNALPTGDGLNDLGMIYGIKKKTHDLISNLTLHWEYHKGICMNMQHLMSNLWYPLVICYIAIENDPIYSGFSHEKW